jgi:hypothetical protein
MDKKRFKWHYTGKDECEKWLLDLNENSRVVAIVTCMSPEGVVSPWWAVYSPFKKKAISQHLSEEDATAYAEKTIAVGEKEERVEW